MSLVVVSEIREITTRTNDKLTLMGFGSAVKAEWVRELQPLGYIEEVRHIYDRLNKRVVAGRVMRYRDLLIGGSPVSEVDLGEAARILAEEFADQPAKLPMWNTQLRQLLIESRFGHKSNLRHDENRNDRGHENWAEPLRTRFGDRLISRHS